MSALRTIQVVVADVDVVDARRREARHYCLAFLLLLQQQRQEPLDGDARDIIAVCIKKQMQKTIQLPGFHGCMPNAM